MLQDNTRRIGVGGLTLNVADTGSGPPVLLLHGFPDSLALWESVAPYLRQSGRRVIAPDLRGFGQSDAPPGRSEYRLEKLVADLAGLLDALAVHEPVDVMGHDWGAVLAWCFGMTHPERVKAVVAISVGHPRAYALAGLEQKRKGLYTLGWQFRGFAERWLADDDYAGLRRWLRSHPAAESCIRDLARPGRLTAGLNWYRANLPSVLFRRWPPCRVPMLGVWSSEDAFLAEDQMRDSGRQTQGPWRFERIEGAGHWLPLERPAEIARLATDWFNQVPGSGIPVTRDQRC